MSVPISIEKVKKSRLAEVDLSNVPFGRVFSDHMLVADYEDGAWKSAKIQAYDRLSLSPASMVLHYGQEIFEGMKAYKDKDGKVVLFRPEKNWERFNHSAERMCMPSVPENIFLEGLHKLLELDKDWIPSDADASLYIRPFMIATDEYVGVKPSEKYKFIIFTCPVRAYYTEPVRVKIEQKYVRAADGGTGKAKAGGNYAGSLYPAKLAQKEGFHQLLWTDAKEHKYIEESGTMNVFIVIDGKVYTHPLTGTILEGVTRDSTIQLLKDGGFEVIEEAVTVEQLVEAATSGRLEDMFGTGTAATVAHIKSFGIDGKVFDLPQVPERKVSNYVLKKLERIKRREEQDDYGWVVEVEV